MHRILRMFAIPVLALAVLGEAGTAAAATAARSGAAAAPCTGTIQVAQFAFSPATVPTGQGSTASVTAVNCTAQSVQSTVTWYGRYLVAGSSNIPPGCPVIDPVAFQAAIAPNGQYTGSLGYGTFATCAATQLQVTVSFDGPSGAVFAQATATLNITQSAPPSFGCHVTYTLLSEWRGGFVSSLAITNTGNQPINGWSLAFAFGGDQKITNAWGRASPRAGTWSR